MCGEERMIYNGEVGGERHVGGRVCLTVAEARGGRKEKKREKSKRKKK